MDLQECLDSGALRKIGVDKKLVEKEFKEADYDIKKAEEALESKDFKWAIVKSYYSMFHSAKALLFSFGYMEKKHFAVQVFLEDMSRKGKLESLYLEYLSAAMDAREGADYRYTYSENIANSVFEYAEKFIERMRKLWTS